MEAGVETEIDMDQGTEPDGDMDQGSEANTALADDAMSLDDEIDDETEALGPGEIRVNGRRFLIHEWLGEEYTRLIHDFVAQAAKPPPFIPGLKIELLEHQKSGVHLIQHACQGPFKGVLCGDEMGLGKTLQVIAAVQSAVKPPRDEWAFNLVVTLKGCVPQWVTEITKNFDPAPKVLELTDSSTTAAEIIADGYDWVVVSYQFFLWQFKRLQKFQEYCALAEREGVFAANRAQRNQAPPKRPTLALLSPMLDAIGRNILYLVLDEIQCARNPNGKIHQALKALQYRHVVMLSGTFLANQWHDVHGPLRFLKGHPFDTVQQFRHAFVSPNVGGATTQTTSRRNRLLRFMMPCTFARPSSILPLPNKQVIYRSFHLDDEAEDRVLYYTQLFYDLMRTAQQLRRERRIVEAAELRRKALGSTTRARQYAANLAVVDQPMVPEEARKMRERVKRLRAAFLSSSERTAGAVQSAYGSTAQLAAFVESHAGERIPQPPASRTGKAQQTAAVNADGPGEPDNLDDPDYNPDHPEHAADVEVADQNVNEGLGQMDIVGQTHVKADAQWKTRLTNMADSELLSPRIREAVQQTLEVQALPGARLVVFSQYLKVLDLLSEALRRRNISSLRLDGTKSSAQRKEAIDRFSTLDCNEVLLVTAGAGGVGLNLTAGTHMIQMEVWWNVNGEHQAHHRIWRKGQTQNVTIYILRAVNSVIDCQIEKARDSKIEYNNLLMTYLRREDSVAPEIPHIGRNYSVVRS